MKTYIEEDVLFTQKDLEELKFIFINDLLEVYEDSKYIGSLLVYDDNEMKECLKEDDIEYEDEDIKYVYINNELHHLYKLEVDYQ